MTGGQKRPCGVTMVKYNAESRRIKAKTRRLEKIYRRTGLTSSSVYAAFRRGACSIKKRRNLFGLDHGFSFKSSMLRGILEALKWDPWNMSVISASFSLISWVCESMLARSSRHASPIFVDFVSFMHVCHESSASDQFQRSFFLEWIIATSFSPDCQRPLWLLCSVSSLINAAARFVADLHPCDHVTGTLRDPHWQLESCTNCALWCMRLNLVHAAPLYNRNMLTPVAELPVARTFVLLHLGYIMCRAHERNLVPGRSRLPAQQHELHCH